MSGGVTTNYGLKKPNFNARPWDSDINGNFDLIDAILYALTQIPNIGGVWRNSTQYMAGQNVLDGQSLTFYQCLVSNVSAATGSFAADRAANPANWAVTSAGQGVVRYDQGQVLTAGQLAQVMANLQLTGVLKYDGAQTLTYQQILQVLNNLLIDGTESTLASATTTDVGNAGSQNVVITGTTTITSFGNRPNKYKLIRFTDSLVLTNGSALQLPGGVNIQTLPNDTAIATSDASGNWRVRHYTRAGGSQNTFSVVLATVNDIASSGNNVLVGSVDFVAVAPNAEVKAPSWYNHQTAGGSIIGTFVDIIDKVTTTSMGVGASLLVNMASGTTPVLAVTPIINVKNLVPGKTYTARVFANRNNSNGPTSYNGQISGVNL